MEQIYVEYLSWTTPRSRPKNRTDTCLVFCRSIGALKQTKEAIGVSKGDLQWSRGVLDKPADLLSIQPQSLYVLVPYAHHHCSLDVVSVPSGLGIRFHSSDNDSHGALILLFA